MTARLVREFAPIRLRWAMWAGLGTWLVSCGSHEPARVRIQTQLLAPRGLIAQATKLSLAVFDGDVGCNANNGRVLATGIDPLLVTELARCDGAFCGTIQLPQSERDRVFQAIARIGDVPLAQGCVTARLDAAQVNVDIRMQPYSLDTVCGDGKVDFGEQCDPPGNDAQCDATCHTIEIVASNGGQPGPASRATASSPSLFWMAGSGEAGRLVALFGDDSAGRMQVAARVFDDRMNVVATPSLFQSAFFLPSAFGEPTPAPSPGQQFTARITIFGDRYLTVFADDSAPTGAREIHARTLTLDMTPDQTRPTPYVGVNGDIPTPGAGEPGNQVEPAVALGRAGNAFIAWLDEPTGTVFGRTMDPRTLRLGPSRQISGGTSSHGVALAGVGAGWVATWESDGDIYTRSIEENGLPQGGVTRVNEDTLDAQTGATIASLPDGRFAIAWSSRGRIFAQRYTSAGTPIGGDQDSPVSDPSASGQSAPALAGLPSSRGAYAVVWLDGTTGHVRGRLLGGDAGFLANYVNALPIDFQVSVASGRERARPAVSVGGSGPFLAVAWEDRSLTGGITMRRFPIAP